MSMGNGVRKSLPPTGREHISTRPYLSNNNNLDSLRVLSRLSESALVLRLLHDLQTSNDLNDHLVLDVHQLLVASFQTPNGGMTHAGIVARQAIRATAVLYTIDCAKRTATNDHRTTNQHTILIWKNRARGKSQLSRRANLTDPKKKQLQHILTTISLHNLLIANVLEDLNGPCLAPRLQRL